MAGLKQLYKERDKLIKAEANLAIEKHYNDVVYNTGSKYDMGVKIINEELANIGITPENYPEIAGIIKSNRMNNPGEVSDKLRNRPVSPSDIAKYLKTNIKSTTIDDVIEQDNRGTKAYKSLYEKKIKSTFPQLDDDYGWYSTFSQEDTGGTYGKRKKYDKDFAPIIGGTPMLDPVNVIARRGRNGDSELREVDGQMAHVTQGEASLIDILGESVMGAIKERGAGTINPSTGLKEYHLYDDSYHNYRHMSKGSLSSNAFPHDGGDVPQPPPPPPKSELAQKIIDITGGDISNRDANLYFGDIYDETPAEQVEKEAELSRDILDKKRSDLQSKTSGAMRDVMSQADKVAGQTGFATSGGLQMQLNQSIKDSMSSYKSGLTNIDLESQDIDLGLEKSLYDIKSSQDKEFFSRLLQAEQADLL